MNNALHDHGSPKQEVIAGFSIIQVKSLEEAIEWVKRAANVFPNGEAEIEIRKVMDDIPTSG